MDFAQEDIDQRMLREQQVEANRVIEAIDNALEQDGDTLLSTAELAEIRRHRDNLEVSIETSTAEQLKQLIKSVEDVSEHYVAKRMNASVKQALTGKQIDEIEL